MNSSTRVLLMIMCISLFSISGYSQHSALSQSINLNIEEKPLDEVLKRIEAQIPLSFAYNPEKIAVRALVTYKKTDIPLAQVLSYLSSKYKLQYRIVEQQLILLPVSEESPLKFTVSGYAYDKNTGEALIGASIVIDSTFSGTTTNGYGYYSIMLPYGNHTLSTSYLGYEKEQVTFDLVINLKKDFNLTEETPHLKEVLVISNLSFNPGLVQTGKVSLTPKLITSTPIALGEYDVIKSLETVPGISLQSEGSTFFYVRGGNKDQNLILIDDAPIYNPTHMLGLYSSIVPDAVNSVDVYKSDFPLSKGGRLSSVIDIKTKEGNKNRFSAWGNAGLITTQLGIEGPFKKSSSSYILTGRLSRIKWYYKREAPDIDKFRFSDLTGKMNFRVNNKNRLYFSFYSGSDQFLTIQSGLSWSNNNGSIRWNHLINDNTFVNTTVYGSNYEYLLHIDRGDSISWRSRVGEMGVKADFSQFVNGNQELSYGININGRTINPGNLTGLDTIPPEYLVSVRNNIETAAYFQHKIRKEKWGLKYGLRASIWTSIGEAFEYIFNENGLATDTIDYNSGTPYNSYFRLEPRITMSYFLNNNSSIKASYGRTIQNLHLITNSISPFTSFEVWLPSGPNIRPQESNQFSTGFTYYLSNLGISFEFETYFKYMINQLDYKAHAATMLNPTLESELIVGKSKTYGTEILVKKDEGRIRGLAGYTWARAKSKYQEYGSDWFNSYSDRPHNINIMLSYDVRQRITIGANFTYFSGLPFSSPTAFYTYNGAEIPYYGSKNNDRFPAYHRLDLSMKFVLNKNPESIIKHSLTISLYNLYSHKNPVFINFNKSLSNDGKFEIPNNLYDANRLTTHQYLYALTPAINYHIRF